MTSLNTKWVLWYHNLSNSDWSIKGYNKIYDIETVEDFWKIHLRLTTHMLQNGMFFFMKNSIEPLWENSANIDGGCWSYKISKKECYISWVEIAMAICGETLLNEKYNNIINGVSISPKKNFSIIKIWNNDYKQNDQNLLSKNIYNLNTTQCLYKAHKERNN